MSGKGGQQIATSSPSVNWSNFLEQLIRDYETHPAKGLAHGLQKDAIQNGWGARDGNKKFRFEISLLKKATPKPLVTLTDHGTVGLIGDILKTEALPDQIPSSQRLARFESMFESGAQQGPGLFGRGKLIFNAASRDGLIYYDSYTKGGDYRFNFRGISGREYLHFPRILEGADAKRELQKRTQGVLSPLSEPGTRIVLVNPRAEVVDAIESGSLSNAIEETWWEIVHKHGAEIRVVTDVGDTYQAAVPSDYGSLPKVNQKGWSVLHVENVPIDIDRRVYRIKRIHLLVPPAGQKVREDLRGVSVHRKGMKIGEIRLSVVPNEIAERFFGYVELDKDYENLISALENTTHYGFASLHRAPYRLLRQQVQERFDELLERLGLKKKGKDPEERMRRALEDAQADLNSILHDLGVPSFGEGPVRKAGLHVSVENLSFPDDSNYVRRGDRIVDFHFRVRNHTSDAKSVWMEVYTQGRDAGVAEILQPRRRIDIERDGEHRTVSFEIDLSDSRYPSGTKIGCTCKVTDIDKSELASKTFYFYLDLEKQTDEELAAIKLLSATWPRSASRRVDFEEHISAMRYEVENLTSRRMKLRLKLRTLWAAEGNTPIEELGGWDLNLSPSQSEEVLVDSVAVTRDRYQDIGKGQVNLRCHAVAMETTKSWEKGEKVAEHTVGFFLNSDPSLGFFEGLPEYFEGGASGPRSAVQSLGARSWKLRINTTHPAFVATKEDDERAKNYLFEQMAAQIAYVLVHTDQVKALHQLDLGKVDSFTELSPGEVLERVAFRLTDRITASYYGS